MTFTLADVYQKLRDEVPDTYRSGGYALKDATWVLPRSSLERIAKLQDSPLPTDLGSVRIFGLPIRIDDSVQDLGHIEQGNAVVGATLVALGLTLTPPEEQT